MKFKHPRLGGVSHLNANELTAKNASLEAEISALKQRIEKLEQLHRDVVDERDLLRGAFDAMSVGVHVVDMAGNVLVHNAALRHIHHESENISMPSTDRDVFLPDGVTRAELAREPAYRALHGQPVEDLESIVRLADSPDQVTWISQASAPIRDEQGQIRAAVVVTRDVTEHKELVQELDAVVAATVEEKRLLIEKLEAGVRELSTPIIEVWDDVLALPVIGTVDERRGAEMTSRVLDEIVARGVRFVIVDWTGVETLDAQSAQHLLNLARCVELVGAECILTGIRPAVATALLDLDVHFEHLRLLRNLKYGLRYCLRRVPSKTVDTQSKRTGSSSSTH